MKYEEVYRFARQNGDVKGWAKEGEVTLLKSGIIDAVKFWEEEVVRFEHKGKTYSREEFEQLLRRVVVERSA
ncbi:MAG: hypothetical protein NVS9B5_34920 [Terriglobales bacterium]